MQARAVFEAAAIVQKEGIKVRPEIMIPLVGFKKELDLQIEVVHQAAREVQAEQKVKLRLHGRHDDRGAARRADGRRDRAVGRVLQLRHQRPDADGARHVARRLGLVPAGYAELEIVKKNPFATIDQTGVGQLVEIAVAKGRKTKPNLKIGICGEHGGDPSSIHFFEKVGPRLRELLALPRAGGAAGGGAGGAVAEGEGD